MDAALVAVLPRVLTGKRPPDSTFEIVPSHTARVFKRPYLLRVLGVFRVHVSVELGRT